MLAARARFSVYFCGDLSAGSSRHVPLGELTKDEVRDIARQVSLPVAEKPESMELCSFPMEITCSSSKRIRGPRISLNEQEGDIVTEDGAIIGRHTGRDYTIGQRKGLGFAAGKPVYVLAIDTEKNRIVIGEAILCGPPPWKLRA